MATFITLNGINYLVLPTSMFTIAELTLINGAECEADAEGGHVLVPVGKLELVSKKETLLNR